MTDESHLFDDLSDDDLNKEAPTGFFETPNQREQLRLLRRHVEEESQAPVFVTGPAGFGKTMLVRKFIGRFLRPGTGIEWIDFGKTPDPIRVVDELEVAIKSAENPNRILVVLDGVDGFPLAQLQLIINRLFNWKKVRSIIVTTRNTEVPIRRAREVYVGTPEGKLYGLRDQLVVPRQPIIPFVAPLIVTANDALIEKLKRVPDDLFKISPRKFEEIIADLLSDMGMEVELTPQTRDGGKDILAYMKTELGKFLCLVEAKRYKGTRPVDVSLVRSLFGTLVDHKATSGMLVTTSRFSKEAKAFQENHKYQLSLKDYGDVVSWLLRYKS